MRIAVIGAGKIGATVGARWEAAGHDVVYGLRDPAKRPGAKSIGEALEGAEAVLLAVPGTAVVDLAREHAAALDGKLLLDATNDFRAGPGRFNHFAEVRALLPRARLARAFNTLGWELFAEPQVGGAQADLLFSSPEGDRDQVAGLVAGVGLRPVWVGGEDAADAVDGMLGTWFALTRRLGRRLAFRLLTEDGSA